jgi:hypothetical protein
LLLLAFWCFCHAPDVYQSSDKLAVLVTDAYPSSNKLLAMLVMPHRSSDKLACLQKKVG